MTFCYGAKFKERGPPAPSSGGPQLWNGQKYRVSSGRWGNRGGTRQAEFAAIFAAGGKGKNNKGTGKGKSKSQGEQGKGKRDEKGDKGKS